MGREFNLGGTVPRLGADVPRWYGETVGFWDGDALITWTSNIQGWKVHGLFEFSSRMQTIEIYTPNRDANGRFVGLKPRGDLLRPRGTGETRAHRAQPREAVRLRNWPPQDYIRCVQTIFPDRGQAHIEGTRAM